ncbi:uncharacterized protein PADG_11562 [Paracoccidioides brasiliensis Pb18]|uniref:Uncharacterized protein n=1 Tax=Paracoccidioides brasiliensis (strain Pb18) TaxID=502780 RepID=A0A0A0HVH8_PARBD|nr:uncharacterized protein PADG_11562 [Paracoccidioides brasiliensis Pb18]KGM92363.1 hypothetical protein PADG_11562 [Paracoccidioides brasiliensis Pb18]
MAISAILQDGPMKQSRTVFFLRDIKANSHFPVSQSRKSTSARRKAAQVNL